MDISQLQAQSALTVSDWSRDWEVIRDWRREQEVVARLEKLARSVPRYSLTLE